LTSLAHLFFAFFSTGISLPAMVVLLVHFPTGQIFPGRVRPWLGLFVFLMVSMSLLTLMSESPGGHDPLGSGDLIINPILLPGLVPYYDLLNGAVYLVVNLGFIGATVSLILRYRAAQLQERLQIKWFIWVLSIILFLLLVDLVLNSSESYSAIANSTLALTFLILFYGLIGLAPAVGIGLGILRSRLWDIDLVIRRTLLYTVLTAALGAVYFGSVLLLQQVVSAISGQDSPVVVVLSTLAIAALFTPLRLRIQTVIDRRFYRKKYDAICALEEFSAVASREVELDVLSNKLTSAAQESLQPESVSLWLKKQEVRR
jgi:hypothetical protein